MGGTFNGIDTRDYERYVAGGTQQEGMHHKVYSQLTIKSTPCFLETEIIVKFLICQISTFKRNVVFTILNRISQTEIVRKLIGRITKVVQEQAPLII